MTSRPDLLELTRDALVALANPGFVKRARKDLDAGRVPQLNIDDDQTVTATFDDGVVTRLAAGAAVKDASCSCPAAGWCRHRVTLVLAYQDASDGDSKDPTERAPWTPGDFDDDALLALAGARVLAAAARDTVTVRLSATDGVPTARLPLNVVRFYSSGALSHARCDCSVAGGCVHVPQAVWAFRKAGSSAGSTMTGQLAIDLGERPRADPGLSELGSVHRDLAAACREVILVGAGNADAAVFARFDRVRERARRLGWSWVVADIEEIDRQIRARQSRSTAADPHQLARLLSEAPARLVAAQAVLDGQGPEIRTVEEILGAGTPGSVQLAHLRLVSLGAHAWASADRAGVQIHLLDPDTGQISVLEGSWDGTTPAASRRLLGTTVASAAASQVVTSGATRHALGVLDIAKDRRKTSLNPLGPKSWPDTLGDQEAGTPSWVNHRTLADGVAIVAVSEVVAWGWDPAAQQLRAILETPQGEMILEWAHTSAAPGGVDALAELLAAGTVRTVSGVISRRAGQQVITPLAVASDEIAVVPAVAPVRDRVALPSAPMRVHTLHAQLVAETRQSLAVWTNRGLRQQGRSALEQLEALADRLRRAGLEATGDAVESVARTTPEDPTRAAELFLGVILLVNAVDQRLPLAR